MTSNAVYSSLPESTISPGVECSCPMNRAQRRYSRRKQRQTAAKQKVTSQDKACSLVSSDTKKGEYDNRIQSEEPNLDLNDTARNEPSNSVADDGDEYDLPFGQHVHEFGSERNDELEVPPDLPDDDPFHEIFSSFHVNARNRHLRTLAFSGLIQQTSPNSGDEDFDSNAESTNEGSNSQDSSNTGTADSKKTTKTPFSRRQCRLARQMPIAVLKQLVARPELVEAHDVTAADPLFTLHLKSVRNTVQVPRHWCHKRKYLQGKRGVKKPPFQLPDFIRNTGISDLRQAALDKAEKQRLKAKQRERLRPGLGQLDIDYRVLYEAFFRYQTKPNLTCHGELYYENKEFEIKPSQFIVGLLSEELRQALGMTSDISPPPYLYRMQPAGPPPSYPNLRIPGVNAPIPPGAQYGYQPNGWGAPALDANGQPLWGWAELAMPFEVDWTNGQMVAVDKVSAWGAIRYEDEDQEDAAEEDAELDKGTETQATVGPAIPPTGSFQRKEETVLERVVRRQETSAEDTAGQAAAQGSAQLDLCKFRPDTLYHVLPEKRATVDPKEQLGSTHTYELPNKNSVILDPRDLDLPTEQLVNKYKKMFQEKEK